MNLNAVLITGGSGDIGLGIAKIVSEISWINEVYGIDINNNIPYSYYYKDFLQGPKVNEDNYMQFVSDAVEKFDIDLIIPSSEAEIRFFNDNHIETINGVPLLLPSFQVMDLGFDKLNTALFLKKNNFLFPWTLSVIGNKPPVLPCIIKSRKGSGSKDVSIVTERNLNYYQDFNEDYIFQELLLPEEEEYTCGIFRSIKGEVKQIIFKRILKGGRTGYAVVVKNDEIEQLLNSIANKVMFHGSINVQLRKTNRGPVIFEINPRFSSTLVFRHKLGFKDLEWAILDKFGYLKELIYDDAKIINKKIFRADREIIY